MFGARGKENDSETEKIVVDCFFHRLGDDAFLPGKPQHVLSCLLLRTSGRSPPNSSASGSAPAAFTARRNNHNQLLRRGEQLHWVFSLVETCL